MFFFFLFEVNNLPSTRREVLISKCAIVISRVFLYTNRVDVNVRIVSERVDSVVRAKYIFYSTPKHALPKVQKVNHVSVHNVN